MDSNDLESQIIAKDFFVYDFWTASLAPGAADVPVTKTIQNDSNFLWQKTVFFTDVVDPTYFSQLGNIVGQNQINRILPLITVQLKDTSSGRDQFDRAVSLPSIAGSGEFPFILPYPKIIEARTTLTMFLSNYSQSTTYNNIHIMLIGTKLFMRN